MITGYRAQPTYILKQEIGPLVAANAMMGRSPDIRILFDDQVSLGCAAGGPYAIVGDSIRVGEFNVVVLPARGHLVEGWRESLMHPGQRMNAVRDLANVEAWIHSLGRHGMPLGAAVHIGPKAQRKTGHVESVAGERP